MFRLKTWHIRWILSLLGLISIFAIFSVSVGKYPDQPIHTNLIAAVDLSQIPQGPVTYIPGIPFKLHTVSKEILPMDNWSELNPGLGLKIYLDSDIDAMLEANQYLFKKINSSIISGLKKIEKSDLGRYVAVYLQGGIYADSDVDCLAPIASWLDLIGPPNVNLSTLDFVVGIEFAFPVSRTSRGHSIHLPFQITQFTFAACQGSYFLEALIEEVENQILNISNLDTTKDRWLVLQRTGPMAFTKALLQFVSNQHYDSMIPHPDQVFPLHILNRRGQLIEKTIDGKIIQGLILPQRAFGMRKVKREFAVLTHHRFQGSWKGGQSGRITVWFR